MPIKKYKKTKGFTLVELIVVITILAILGSIAFLSFQDFTAQARDGKRMTDISSLKKGLELYRTSSGDYPLPDSSNTVSSSLGGVISYNGIVGKTVSNNVKLSENIKDPLTLADYKYSISGDKKEYEISYNLEDDSSVALVSQSFAELSEINRVDGNYSGVMTVASNGNYVSAPGLIYDGISADTSLTLGTTSASYLVDKESGNVSFTPSLLATARPKTENEIATVIDNIKTSYASAPVKIQNKKAVSEVIAMDSSEIEDLNNFKDFYVEKRRSATSATNKNSGGGSNGNSNVSSCPSLPSITLTGTDIGANIDLDTITDDSTINFTESDGDIIITLFDESSSFDTSFIYSLVTVTVNGNEFTGCLDSTYNFSINVPGSELLADTLRIVNAEIYLIYANGNIATASSTESYFVDISCSTRLVSIVVPAFSALDSGSNINVTGRVFGDGKAGDPITFDVNGINYSGFVDSSRNWSIPVSVDDLIADSDNAFLVNTTGSDTSGNICTFSSNKTYTY